MKISVLIPCLHEDCTQLKRDLQAVAAREGVDVEVLDGRKQGRAANCNALAARATGDWLLFVDADAAVPPSFSFRAYQSAAREADVVCGGLRHPDRNPNPAATLRYRYERKADARRAARYRRLAPYDRLSTFNLLVRRSLFMQVRFDESIREYGYEDVLFSAELERRGVEILHIDNVLLHMGLEPNAVYLAKAETALRTAYSLRGRLGGHSHVAEAAARLEKWHVGGAARWAFRVARPWLRRNLLSRHPSLSFFRVYKLGYYLNLVK